MTPRGRSRVRRHASLTSLAQRAFGPDAVARVGVGPVWEDREPQRKFVVTIETKSEVAIEVVSDHLRSRAKQRRIVDAVRAAVESAGSGTIADWSAWHVDVGSRLVLGRAAVLTRRDEYARLSVAYGGVDVCAKFWLRNAEAAAAGMFARLVPARAVARMRSADERELAEARQREEERDRRLASDPAYAADWTERAKRSADVMRGLFERDVQ